MSGPGRNDPCPCGSGRKYKRYVESHAARDRLAGRPAYDFGWLWGALGLERPG